MEGGPSGETDGGTPDVRASNSGPARESDAFRRWRAETAALLAEADSARIDVYLRSMLPPPGAKDAQMDVLNELRGLSETTSIGTVRQNVWGERICLCDSCRESETGRRMLNTVRQFEQWGVEYGASAESFFERTRQESSLVGDAYEGIAPPRVTAALYVEGSLQGVFPAQFQHEFYSVHDFARAIARETDGERAPDALESTH